METLVGRGIVDKILKPGGVMTFDDVKYVPACRDAFNMLARKYDLQQHFLNESNKEQGHIIKKDGKETNYVHPASDRIAT